MDEREIVIQSLSSIVAEKRLRYEAMGMMNVNGLDEAERMRRSIAYTQAQSDLVMVQSDSPVITSAFVAQ